MTTHFSFQSKNPSLIIENNLLINCLRLHYLFSLLYLKGEDPHHHGRTSTPVGHEVSTSLIDQSNNKPDTQV